MPRRALSDATWEDARELVARGAIAILPIGATEAHGPHLPLGTDGIIAEAMADACAARLAANGHAVAVLPTLAYTPAPFAAGFAGTVSIRTETAIALLADLFASLAHQGFRVLALANAHFDPANMAAIARAVQASSTAPGLRIAFPDLTAKPWATRLTAEFRSGACHAGRYESSVVMAARPDLVRDETRRSLPENARSLSRAIRSGQHTFEEAGGPRAYFGAPADATTAEGEATLAELGAILEEAVLAELSDVA